ncbi:hypothetical protein L2E82_29868 [Cichorium intybus]|uniref:Uncharacterized protein n=1 Tax=Cichorium intybus TaxID=13427 RepID=A0ACB9CYP1_CICIN|nr:hypothetical protein L2E82_29868 [Cichorium intybus]
MAFSAPPRTTSPPPPSTAAISLLFPSYSVSSDIPTLLLHRFIKMEAKSVDESALRLTPLFLHHFTTLVNKRNREDGSYGSNYRTMNMIDEDCPRLREIKNPFWDMVDYSVFVRILNTW